MNIIIVIYVTGITWMTNSILHIILYQYTKKRDLCRIRFKHQVIIIHYFWMTTYYMAKIERI